MKLVLMVLVIEISIARLFVDTWIWAGVIVVLYCLSVYVYISCKHLLSKKQLKNKSAIESKFFIIKDYKNGKKKKGKELYDLYSYINDNQKN